MNAITHFVSSHGGQSVCARLFGVTQAAVSAWMAGKKYPAPIVAVFIEQATGGALTRQELRPHDWALIWPELNQLASSLPNSTIPQSSETEQEASR